MKIICAACQAEISERNLHGTLSIMRHGRTDMNDAHRIIGSLNDPLNPMGLQQAHQARVNLETNHVKLDRIMSSPLSRAFESANLIAGSKIPVIADFRLRERCVGAYEGQPEFPNMLDVFLSSISIKGGEPFVFFERRVKDVLEEAVTWHRYKNTLFVTHHFLCL